MVMLIIRRQQFFPEIKNDITPHHFILGSEIMSGKDKYLFGLAFNASFSGKIAIDSLQVNQFSNDYLVMFGYQIVKNQSIKFIPLQG